MHISKKVSEIKSSFSMHAEGTQMKHML